MECKVKGGSIHKKINADRRRRSRQRYKHKNMNIINKKVAAVVLGLGVALGAQADGWVNNGLPNGGNIVTTGSSGVTKFTFDNTGGGPFSITATPPTASGRATFFSVIKVASYTHASGNDFTVFVDWTIASGATGKGILEAYITPVNTTDNTDVEPQSASERFTLSSVPEPSQTVAGAMLLGCSGLVFAGRRLFKKQSA